MTRQSPFAVALPSGRRLTLAACPPREIACLQGAAEDAGFLAAAAGILGAALPLAPNSIAGVGEHLVSRLAPGRWWILSPEGAGLTVALESALNGLASVVELGHGWAGLRVAGVAAPTLLAKVCTLDLHPDAFPPGRSAETELRGLPVLLLRRDGEVPTFEVFCQRSYAASVAEWLSDGALEFREGTGEA